MVLPGNVNKASGLKKALKRLAYRLHNVVGIGDAENDQAFLSACGCAVAVENACRPSKPRPTSLSPITVLASSSSRACSRRSDLRGTETRVPDGNPSSGCTPTTALSPQPL